jgi:hypothetical protein
MRFLPDRSSVLGLRAQSITCVVQAELKSVKSNVCREEPKSLREFAAGGNGRQSAGGLTNTAHRPLFMASHYSIVTRLQRVS